MKTIFLSLILLMSCGHSQYQDRTVLSAEDFVIESYRIKDNLTDVEPSGATIMVIGDVNQKGPIPLSSGFMPLSHALSHAGGMSATSDKAVVQIIRDNKIYNLYWEHVLRLPSNSLLLIPGDIVYVPSTPFGNFKNLIKTE